jgi:hypothetical protein
MNKRQKSKLASIIATEAVMQAHPEIAAVPGIPERLTVLSAKVGEISSLAIKQAQPTEAGRLGRDQRLGDMVEMALNIAGLVRTLARAENLPDLGRTVKVAAGGFRRLNAFDQVWLAQSVHDAGRSVLPQLGNYGVTEQTLADLQTRIDAAEESLREPRVSVAARRAATERLVSSIREVEELLREEIDRLIFPLRETQPEIYAAYRAARLVVELPGTRGAEEVPTSAASAPGIGTTATVTSPTAEKKAA